MILLIPTTLLKWCFHLKVETTGTVRSCLDLQWLCSCLCLPGVLPIKGSPLSHFEIASRFTYFTAQSNIYVIVFHMLFRHGGIKESRLSHSESLWRQALYGWGMGEGGVLPRPRMHSDFSTIVACLQRVNLANEASCAALLLAHLWGWVTAQFRCLRRCWMNSSSEVFSWSYMFKQWMSACVSTQECALCHRSSHMLKTCVIMKQWFDKAY